LRSREFACSIVCVALVLGACAAGTQAHSEVILIGDSTLVYEQKPTYPNNLDNNATISLKEDSLGAYYEITDPASTGIAFPPGCTPLDGAQDEIRCQASGITSLYVRLGTGTSTRTTTDSITINAPTPAIVTGGSVTNAGGPRTSNITVGPVGGNVIYGNPGPGTLNALNGFGDTIHSCAGNVVEADLIDTVIADCAPAPAPPIEPPPEPTPTPKTNPTPGAPEPPAAPRPGQPAPTPSQSAPILLTYKRPQAILGRRIVKFGISLAVPGAARARGNIALPGTGGTITLTTARVRIARAGVAVAVQLHVPSRALLKLQRAFSHRRRLYATVQVNATDPLSGIEYSVSRLIALVR
jgi:hypothetical protein